MDDWVQWAIGIILTVQLSMFGWFMKLLSGKASKETTDKRFDQLVEEMKQQRSESRDIHGDVLKELRTINLNLATTNANLANLTGRFEASEGR